MSVRIRLARGGRKKMPFYHVVAADSRRARDSRYIERLGYYNPMAKEGEISLVLKEDRLEYWHGVGAQVSDAIAKLLVAEGKGPQKVRDDFTKKNNARIALKKDELEAKKKAEAEAKAKEEAEAKAKEEAEAKAAAEAEAAENAEVEAPAEKATAPAEEEAPAEEAAPEAEDEKKAE